MDWGTVNSTEDAQSPLGLHHVPRLQHAHADAQRFSPLRTLVAAPQLPPPILVSRPPLYLMPARPLFGQEVVVGRCLVRGGEKQSIEGEGGLDFSREERKDQSKRRSLSYQCQSMIGLNWTRTLTAQESRPNLYIYLCA
jgi:hypothetical protein